MIDHLDFVMKDIRISLVEVVALLEPSVWMILKGLSPVGGPLTPRTESPDIPYLTICCAE